MDIVYQEDYFALLNATETGRRITYNPTNIITYAEDFGEYMKNAVQEVRITLPRLLFPSLSLRETTTNIESECNYVRICLTLLSFGLQAHLCFTVSRPIFIWDKRKQKGSIR